MKNNKKHLVKILACIMIAAAASFSIISCGKKSGTPVDPSDTSDGTGNTGIPDDVDIDYVMDYMNEDLDAYVTLGEYKGLKATVNSYEIDDEYVNSKIKELLESNAKEIEITDRLTQEGDVVICDYSGALDGVKFDGGTAEGSGITLSDGMGYIPGFATGMIGHMPGETFDMDVTFPDPYLNNPDLAGKAVVFTVTVQYIKGMSDAPELDDAFVAENFAEAGCSNVEEFMTYYHSFLEEERAETEKNSAISDVWNQIMTNATAKELPKKSVDALYWSYRSEYQNYANQYGMDYETFLASQVGCTDDDVLKYAQSYVKEDIVIYQIVKAEGLAVTDDEYKAGLADFCEQYGQTEEELIANYGEKNIRSVIQWNKLIDAVYSWSDITTDRSGTAE